MQCGLDRGQTSLADLVQNIPDLVRPATLHGDVRIGHGRCGEQSGVPST